MIALILAGGIGSRLRPYTHSLPKAMIEINGKKIIDQQIESLLAQHINHAVVATGYQAEVLESYLPAKFPAMQFTFVRNTEFETSKPAYAVIMALPHLTDDCLYLNGDVMYDPDILKQVIEAPHESATAIQKTVWDEEEVNVVINTDGFVTNLSKNLSTEESDGEFIGVTKLGLPFLETMKKITDAEGIETFRHSFAIDLLNHVIHQSDHMIKAVDVTHLKAIEIDTPEDLARALEQ